MQRNSAKVLATLQTTDYGLGQDQEAQVTKVRGAVCASRYEVEGELRTPDNRGPRVRTVWQIDEGWKAPRLITAYPTEAHL